MSGESEFVTVAPDDDRLESLAEFAAGAGHEFNNPVATIVGRVQLLLRDEADPARRQALETIAGQAYRIRDMISDVMVFARPPAAEPASPPEGVRRACDGASRREKACAGAGKA